MGDCMELICQQCGIEFENIIMHNTSSAKKYCDKCLHDREKWRQGRVRGSKKKYFKDYRKKNRKKLLLYSKNYYQLNKGINNKIILKKAIFKMGFISV